MTSAAGQHWSSGLSTCCYKRAPSVLLGIEHTLPPCPTDLVLHTPADFSNSFWCNNESDEAPLSWQILLLPCCLLSFKWNRVRTRPFAVCTIMQHVHLYSLWLCAEAQPMYLLSCTSSCTIYMHLVQPHDLMYLLVLWTALQCATTCPEEGLGLS